MTVLQRLTQVLLTRRIREDRHEDHLCRHCRIWPAGPDAMYCPTCTRNAS